MLPNHSPLVIAEQFGTLESLFPGRIDLGLGRAPGTDRPAMRALRRDPLAGDRFPQDVQELQALFAEAVPGQLVRAVPGAGLHIPIWILGSSTFGAQLAAALGLPFAFASHFAPDQLDAALELYRGGFQPSSTLKRPHVMVGVGLVAAESGLPLARAVHVDRVIDDPRLPGLVGNDRVMSGRQPAVAFVQHQAVRHSARLLEGFERPGRLE